MTTIVSAFISNANSYRNIEKYIEYGKKLCSIYINKVIFIEEHIYNTYFKNEIFPLTIFIFINKEKLYFYQYKTEDLTNFNILRSDNPSKDTIEYMYVQCSKTEWVRIAIEINPFNTNQFVWMDFGIYHIMNNDENLFMLLISNLSKKSYENIRIASGICYNLEQIYNKIQWFFLGGIFGGHKDKLLEFADLMKKKCIDIMTDKKTIIWEVNIWVLIILENQELFDRYIANHNLSMLVFY